jgi:hypothetical protein
MTKPRYLVSITVLTLLSGFLSNASAQAPTRLPDKKIKPLLESLEDSTNKFRNALNDGLKKSSIQTGAGEENIMQYVEDLKNSAKRLKDEYNGDRSVSADVEETLRRASYVNNFMAGHPAVTGADDEWAKARQNLETLAQAFNVRWRGDAPDARPFRLKDDELKKRLDLIKNNSNKFRGELDKALKSDKSIDNKSRENVINTVKSFADHTQRVKDRVGEDDSGAQQMTELLRLGETIDRFMHQYSLNSAVQSQWSGIRGALAETARAYNSPLKEPRS